ncbi:auxilin-like protein, partial [Trifolium medium]|nr:auxilin-like protein [Trifolium medium]
HTGVYVKKETPVKFLTDPQEVRSTLRPADVLVYGWIGRKHACVDLIGVSPLVGLMTGDFIVGQATLKAASSKIAKHEKSYSDNQHAFIPFSFDTFGFLAPDAVDILKIVQRVMHNNIVSHRFMKLVFKRISFVI